MNLAQEKTIKDYTDKELRDELSIRVTEVGKLALASINDDGEFDIEIHFNGGKGRFGISLTEDSKESYFYWVTKDKTSSGLFSEVNGPKAFREFLRALETKKDNNEPI